MEINKDLLLKIAKTARLNLTDAEIDEFLPQLEEVLENFKKIDKVDTKNVSPALHPIEIKPFEREDKVEKCLDHEKVLALSKLVKNDYFVGPRIKE